MIIDGYRREVKNYFWWEDAIAKEVALAKADRKARRHSRTLVGIDDPTGEFVVHKNAKIKKVVIVVKGKRIIIRDPERWLEVIHDTYVLYSRQPISNMIQERIKHKKSADVISGLMGISRETYYRWENEFLDDAVFLAGKAGLYNEKK